jgi:uncharacterized membrane protein
MADQSHLAGDIRRLNVRQIPGLFVYLEYLKTHYTFLLLPALSTNSFDAQALVVVR